MKRTTENWVAGGLIGAYLIYVALRAWLLPITHEEGVTILNYVPRLFIDTLLYQKEANPNNYILNTLAIKTLLGLLPGHQFVVRLPALLGCGLYLWAGSALCRRLSEHPWVRLFGLAVLVGNPFLAEYFGLAQGHGLAIGLMLLALYRAWQFFENNTPHTLRSALLFAGLAGYANFALLLFFMPFSLLLFWAAWQQNRSWAAFWPTSRPAFYTLGIYLLLWIAPVGKLYAQESFGHWTQRPANLESLQLLVRHAIRGNAYLGGQTVSILSWAALVILLAGWSIAAWQWRRENARLATTPKVFLAAVSAGVVTCTLLQINVLHTAPLHGGDSLFFYPLLALVLIIVADWCWTRKGRLVWAFLAPVLALVLINNIRCLNLHSTTEWWYDRSTFLVLDKIKSIQTAEGRTEPYSLDCHWAFLNSFMVHVGEFPQGYNKVVKLVDWHADRIPIAGPDFFFLLNEGEVNVLHDRYEVVYKAPTGTLLRKK